MEVCNQAFHLTGIPLRSIPASEGNVGIQRGWDHSAMMTAEEYVRQLEAEHDMDLLDVVGRSEEFVGASLETDRLFGVDRSQHPDGPGPSAAGYSFVEGTRKAAAEYRDDLMSVMKYYAMLAFSSPVFGFIPLLEFNAFATRAPNGEAVCVLDNFLFNYFHYTSIALSECTIRGEDGPPPTDQKEALLYGMFATFWFCGMDDPECVRYLRSERKRPFSVDPDRVWFAGCMSEAMLIFVLAHELAHHSLGHLNQLQPRKLFRKKGAEPLYVYSRSQQEEFAADSCGLRTFLGYMQGDAPLIRCQKGLALPHAATQCAPLLFFDLLAIAEEAVLPAIIPDCAVSRSHPPARDRAIVARKDLEARCASDALSYYNQAALPFVEELGDIVVETLTRMAEQARARNQCRQPGGGDAEDRAPHP